MADTLAATFPYPPYDIQQQFMINVFDALENKQIGLFESPTGTGKTLSVICSTLHWLEVERDRQAAEAAAAASAATAEGLPDWLAAADTTATAPAAAQREVQPRHKPRHKAKAHVLDDEGNDLSEFLPDGATDTAAGAAAREHVSPGSKRSAPDLGGYSSGSSDEEDIAPGGSDVGPQSDAAAQAEVQQPQIIFCSRTHSQLSQFVGELHRTRFADSSLLVAVASRKALCINDEVRQLSDLSQINERCLDLQRSKPSPGNSSNKRQGAPAAGAQQGNTDAAASLTAASISKGQQRRQQRSSSRKAAGCPYLSRAGGGGGAAPWDDFREMVLATPLDVEELANLGRRVKLCPYYGSRRAVPSADVVLAPYSAVLMPDARDSLGIQLQGAVLVFDEAHNLLDAINSAHSTSVTGWQLLSVQRSFTAYYDRFKGVLNPVNAQNVQRLLHIASALHKCLTTQQHNHTSSPSHTASSSSSSSGGRVTTVNDLMFDLGLDNINMIELAHWVKHNKMAFKVSGYTAAAVAKAGGSVQLQGSRLAVAAGNPAQDAPQQQQQYLGRLSSRDGVSAIHSFVSFLLSLTHADADGRIIIDPATPATASAAHPGVSSQQVPTAPDTSSNRTDQAQHGGQLRYVLLNAARHFGQLLCQARSVLLVSGTLAPVEGLQAQLFPDAPPERVRHFACGHVVPSEQLLTIAIGRGPSGKALNLRHEARCDSSMMAELGQLLVNLCGVVPEGLVVFLPSFAYLQQLTTTWKSSGLWDRLALRKQVFSEPRAASEVESVLASYAAAISGNPTNNTSEKQAQPAADAGVLPAAPSSNRVSGALMLCVVGGKLSEGINFGDGLGRCVVVVGLPFPNPTDVELQARMQYLDRMAAAAATVNTAGHGSGTAAVCTQGAASPAASANPSVNAVAGQQEGQQLQPQQHLPELQPAPTASSAFHIINQPANKGRRQLQAPAAAVRGVGPPSAAGCSATCGVAAPQHHQAVSAAAALAAQAEASPSAIAAPGAALLPPTHSAATPYGAAAGIGSSVGVPGRGPGSTAATSSSARLITGRDYYEDLCFKAVNQCVGRVVRHKGDYAAVVLCDTRWVADPTQWTACSSTSSSRCKVPAQKLPGWLQKSYVATNGDFAPALKQLAAFYKRQTQPSTS